MFLHQYRASIRRTLVYRRLATLVCLMGLCWHAAAPAAEYTAEDYRKAVMACVQARDDVCAEKNWRQLLRLRPTDGKALANLGILMNRKDKHQEAVAHFERAIGLGEGTYDLFGFYADSLGKLGRTEEAIDWSYKSLAAWPRTVDVRGNLAKLLVLQKRHYEALAVLSVFDDVQRAQGYPPYFEGQRIAIETLLDRDPARIKPQGTAMRLSKFESHFYAPVTLGEARPVPFVVDTGASKLSLSDALLMDSKAAYKVLNPAVGIVLADGRRVKARLVAIESLKVGPYALKNVQAVVCQRCVPLLGESALAKFDMKSTRTQGVDFMLLSPR